MENRIKEYVNAIEQGLREYCMGKENLQRSIYDAMNYSLLSGGKRLRPLLTLEFCRVFSGSYEEAIPFACAVEMIHTYSLIHDDLPAMDNDDLRRGMPTNHIEFGEAHAILAGDALLTKAFEIASNAVFPKPDKQLWAITLLASASGADGMVGGQIVDIESEDKQIPIDTLRYMHRLKTGALIKASCEIGAVLGGCDEEDFKNVLRFAENLGIAFQIRDDILDVLGDEEYLGKHIGSDSQSKKSTYVSILGIVRAEELCHQYTDSALSALKAISNDTEFLEYVTDRLVSRKR